MPFLSSPAFRYGLNEPKKTKVAILPNAGTTPPPRFPGVPAPKNPIVGPEQHKPSPAPQNISVKYLSDEYYNLLKAAPTKPVSSLRGLGEVVEPKPWYKHPLVIVSGIALIAYLLLRKKG